jgi:hypothetical protein
VDIPVPELKTQTKPHDEEFWPTAEELNHALNHLEQREKDTESRMQVNFGDS